ncbi:hypothetical protein MMC25_007242 [Agyrium rufum]|nr:hypothetical protein [Agyrium rufum]
MENDDSPRAVRARKRKSIGALPSSDILFEKENTESAITGLGAKSNVGAKKSRSKSLGPGGLAALREGTGNQRKDLPLIKSILKPTIPISPPKAIPPRTTKPGTPRKGRPPGSPNKNSPKKGSTSPFKGAGNVQNGLQNRPDPFDDAASKETPEAQLTRELEEKTKAAAREAEKKAILEKRDARRKSMANRRVSFAPEATLHTWDLVETGEDATTSSEATNSTRRASSLSNMTGTSFPGTPNSGHLLGDPEPPSTPPEQVEEPTPTASPAHQRDLHQKKRRRSSGIPPMNFNNPDDFSSSPTSMAGSDDASPSVLMEVDEDDNSSSSDEGDLIETESPSGGDRDVDLTGRSIASDSSDGHSSTSSSKRLNDRLRQAAQLAGLAPDDQDRNGEMTMELADDDITASFKPWAAARSTNEGLNAADLTSHQDQENMNPFSPAFKANLEAHNAVEEQDDQTMDFTQVGGGILSAPPTDASPKPGRRKSVIPKRRQSENRRRSSGGSSAMGDETTDFTMALGGVQETLQPSAEVDEVETEDENEDLTMEFTAAVGGLINQAAPSQKVTPPPAENQNQEFPLQATDRRMSSSSVTDDGEMEMTAAVGGILDSITEHTEPSEDGTFAMDITAAVGAILPNDLKPETKSLAKQLMESETDHGQLTRSPAHERSPSRIPPPESSKQRSSLGHSTTRASEFGSPSVAVAQNRRPATRRSVGRNSVTPKGKPRQSTTPMQKPATPSKQMTPRTARPETPSKTPPSRNIAMRTASPKKLFRTEIEKQSEASPQSLAPSFDFALDAKTRLAMPSINTTPKARRTSGLGIDREGLGSPRLATIFDRRASIGDTSASFTPQGAATTGVRFEDPRAMELEIEQERMEDERRESGRNILQHEADFQDPEEENVTANLKDLIQSMTPKKNKMRGRKSLAVGGARGILGKRPAELDDQEESDDNHTPKRLKGQSRSPVKSIKLPNPPSKAETTGRLGKVPRFSLGLVSGNNAGLESPTTEEAPASPVKVATTPKGQNRFKNVNPHGSAAKSPVSFGAKLADQKHEVEEVPEVEDRIHLQDFLNLTSIRFMELTTTKRRHTLALNGAADDSIRVDGSNDQLHVNGPRDLESCIIAGVCTVPMLELYQHSCRELKRYIAEGRSIVREIEVDTYEDQPLLFREYITATPDVRVIMDTQFKNVKTHARLLSKAMWYEWRTKLLDGLKEGLIRIGEGLMEDDRILTKQESLLEPVVPGLVEEEERLEGEVQELQAKADELADCDQEELKTAREELAGAEEEVDANTRLLEELQEQLRLQEEELESLIDRKDICITDIKEADKVSETCRGWSNAEVSALKANVDALEASSGWTITSTSGPSMTLTYNRTLALFLTPSAFQTTAEKTNPNAQNSPISLTYIADDESNLSSTSSSPAELSTTLRFFLQYLRAYLHSLSQPSTPISSVLKHISETWTVAIHLESEIRRLNLSHMSEARIVADEAIEIRTMILMKEKRMKVDVCWTIDVSNCSASTNGTTRKPSGVLDGVKMDVNVSVVYGETGLNEAKMGDFVRGKLGKRIGEGEAGKWASAVRDLEVKLRGRVKKGVA